MNVPQLWARLTLTATQLARLTGVSRRQVEWWRRRGYITPSPDAPDRFNGDAVVLALLIKQAIDGGIPLARAFDLAVAHVASTLSDGLARAARTADASPDPAALLDLEQKLLASYNTIGLVLQAMAPLARRVEQEFDLLPAPRESIRMDSPP